MMHGHPAGDGTSGSPGPTRRASQRWALAIVAALIVVLVFLIRYEILPFVIAAAVGFIFDPLLQWLQPRLGGRRWVSAILLYLLLILVAGLAVYWVGSVIVRDVANLATNGPTAIHGLISEIIGPQGTTIFGQTITADSLTRDLQSKVAGLIGPATYAMGVGIGIAVLLGVFLTLVLMPYFMISGPRLVDGMVWLLPPNRRASARRLLPRITPVLRRYMVGVVVVVCCTSIAAYAGFGLVFHLPHAVLLSIAVGALETIPALGPFTSLVLVGLSAIQQHSVGVTVGLIAYAVFLRLGIDNVLGPVVLGQSAKLHPVAVIFAFVVGAAIFGVVGLLLAVPTAASIVIVLEQCYADPSSQGEDR